MSTRQRQQGRKIKVLHTQRRAHSYLNGTYQQFIWRQKIRKQWLDTNFHGVKKETWRSFSPSQHSESFHQNLVCGNGDATELHTVNVCLCLNHTTLHYQGIWCRCHVIVPTHRYSDHSIIQQMLTSEELIRFNSSQCVCFHWPLLRCVFYSVTVTAVWSPQQQIRGASVAGAERSNSAQRSSGTGSETQIQC